VVVSDVPGDGSRVHTHDHDGSEAPDNSPDSILLSEPKPLGNHRPLPLPSILSPGESSYPPKLYDPSIDLSHGHRFYLWNCLCRIYPSIPNTIPNISNLLSPFFSIYCADKSIIYPPTSGGGMYRDGGSGSSGGDDDGSIGDGTGGGDKYAGGVVHLARRSPVEGGDSEIGGDGDGVVMVRSLSTSVSGGRDMEA
ncbi:hypothetical protein Tco_1137336, partial [Tanacetum coccineum]